MDKLVEDVKESLAKLGDLHYQIAAERAYLDILLKKAEAKKLHITLPKDSRLTRGEMLYYADALGVEFTDHAD